MATYDETARQACKVEGEGLVRWLEGFAKEPWGADFGAWDDTRRAAWPGGPERIDDVVCVLRRRKDGKKAHLVVEAATEPGANDLARLGVYQLLLAIEVRAVLEDGPPIYGVIIHLTGGRKGRPLRLTRLAKSPGVLVQPTEVWLSEVSAPDTLALIAAEKVALCVLPWLVLMRGGGDPTFIEDWKKVASKELDLDRLARYRYFALSFAELIPELLNWQSALGGWQVRETKLSVSIRAEGELRGRRAALIEGLEAQLGGPTPEPIRLAIEGTNDPATLRRWGLAMLKVGSWTEFEQRMKQP
jgi:hypothetical protein